MATGGKTSGVYAPRLACLMSAIQLYSKICQDHDRKCKEKIPVKKKAKMSYFFPSMLNLLFWGEPGSFSAKIKILLSYQGELGSDTIFVVMVANGLNRKHIYSEASFAFTACFT